MKEERSRKRNGYLYREFQYTFTFKIFFMISLSIDPENIFNLTMLFIAVLRLHVQNMSMLVVNRPLLSGTRCDEKNERKVKKLVLPQNSLHWRSLRVCHRSLSHHGPPQLHLHPPHHHYSWTVY